MKVVTSHIRTFVHDEAGAVSLEYALAGSLVIGVLFVTIGAIATRVAGMFASALQCLPSR